MEALIKIFFCSCLFSLTIGFQFSPPLSIKTPVDFGVDIGALKTDLENENSYTGALNERSISTSNQCFCFPNNTNNQLVTDHLDPNNQGIERLVVYLYNTNGLLQAYIPNVQKQAMIPDLDFDKNEGDILKPVFLNTVGDIFKDGPVIVQNSHSLPNKLDVNGEDKINVESEDDNTKFDPNTLHKQELPTVNTDEDNENKHKTNDVDKGTTSMETSSDIDDEKISLFDTDYDINDKNPPSIETTYDIDTERTPFIQKSKNIDDTPSTGTPNDVVNESLVSNDSSDDSIVKPLGSSAFGEIKKPIDAQIKPNADFMQTLEVNKQTANPLLTDNKNFYNNDRLQQILSILPPDAKVYLETLISQLKNPYSEVSAGNNYIRFDDWFKDQMTRVVVQNLETSSNINALRNHIIEVLKSNGLYLTSKGILIDALGNIQKMTNIKLRPILIGDPVEYQNMLNYQSKYSYAKQMEISYLQVILITQVDPPSILGIVPLGTVYLPRNLKRKQNVYFLSDPEIIQSRSGACKNCKLPNRVQIVKPGITSRFQQLPSIQREQLMRRLLENPKDLNVTPQPQRRVSNEMGNNQFNNIVNKLFGIFRTTNALGGPTRRLLGGRVLKPVPEPQTENPNPNDDLPGIRIIGGSPATSSGVPIASKGRSAFEGFKF